MSESAKSAALPKVRIATTSLAGCFGCHTSFLDIDERIFSHSWSPRNSEPRAPLG